MTGAVPVLTDEEMAAIAGLVYTHTGIRLAPTKTALVTARLQQRLRLHRCASFHAYLRHVRHDASGAELRAMLDALTTNQTEFFREREHFGILTERVLPQLRTSGATSIAAWSAGCATGEEAYSLAMTLVDGLGSHRKGTIDLLASDICSSALAVAARGVFPVDHVRHVPAGVLKRYFERGTGQDLGLARVRREIRQLVHFEHHNLMEPYPFTKRRDFIWCRNTLMYFDGAARRRALGHLADSLVPGGYLFVSHSEHVHGVAPGLERVAPGVYRRSQT